MNGLSYTFNAESRRNLYEYTRIKNITNNTHAIQLSYIVSLLVILLFCFLSFGSVSCFIVVSNSSLVSDPVRQMSQFAGLIKKFWLWFLSLCVFPLLWLSASLTPVSHCPHLTCVYSLWAPCLQCQFVFVVRSKCSSISPSDSLPHVFLPCFQSWFDPGVLHWCTVPVFSRLFTF